MIDFNKPDAIATAGNEYAAASAAMVKRIGQPTVATVADLAQAVVDREQLGAAIASVEAFFKPLKAMAHQLHAALCAREKAIVAPLRQLDDDTRAAMSAFKAAEDRDRRRREAAIADEQRRDRDARAVAEAAVLERSGERAMAAAVVAEAIAAPAPVVVLPDAVAAVADFRRVWKWRYAGNDKARAVALIPREYMTPDEVKIGAHARSMKESASIAGIEFYAEDVPVR